MSEITLKLFDLELCCIEIDNKCCRCSGYKRDTIQIGCNGSIEHVCFSCIEHSELKPYMRDLVFYLDKTGKYRNRYKYRGVCY